MPQRVDAATSEMLSRERSNRAATRDVLNVRPSIEDNPELFFPRRSFDGDLLPAVPHAPAFRREPMAVGTETGRAVDALLKIAPELRGQVRSVNAGPTRASMSLMMRSGLSPDAFAGTSLQGVTDLMAGTKNEIGLNPVLMNDPSGRSFDQTLVHEARHAVGGDEDAAQASEAAAPRLAPWSPIGTFLRKVGLR